jgi:hypothetical protein
MAGGGAGGTPDGEAGAAGSDGTNDGSSNYGGAGGNSPFGTGGATPDLGSPDGKPGFGPGAGGSGASSPDRTGNLNWPGGPGTDGIVAFAWGDEAVLPSRMPPPPVPITPQPIGSAPGGGGGKIICTKLYELGMMSKDIYEADQAFGANLVQIRPDIYNGYRAWAEIVVDWMSGSGPKMMPWMTDDEFSIAAKKWSIAWAYDIATPWAEQMAYVMGKKDSGSLTGRMITTAGIPICKAVGMWQRIVGPSKKPAGFIKGVGLIAIFIMFKTIAELGRAIEGKKEKKLCIQQNN